jgi:hypothetical protein
MAQELVGYRLKGNKYERAVQVILSDSMFNNFIPSDYKFRVNKLKEAGVLDIWFEPVYKEVEKQPIPWEDVEVKSIPADNESYIRGWEDKTWYKHRETKAMVFHETGGKYYGVDNRGKWIDGTSKSDKYYGKSAYWEKASNKEVARMLHATAINMGYEKGTYIKYGGELRRIDTVVRVNNQLKVWVKCEDSDGQLVYVNLYRNGKWLSIVDLKDNTWYYYEIKSSITSSFVYHKEFGKALGRNVQGKWFSKLENDWRLLEDNDLWRELSRAQVKGLLEGEAKDRKLLPKKYSLSLIESKLYVMDHSNDDEWVLLDLETGEWSDKKIAQLPKINNHEGKFENETTGNIIYGSCGILRPEWFTSSRTRYITEMKLSSGVVIKKDQIDEIREFLRQDPSLGRWVGNSDGNISLEDRV